VEKVHQVIHDGRHHMIYGVSNILGWSQRTCQHLTEDLNMMCPICCMMTRSKTDFL
jgi:hypothetical protein